jgi:hypothetical protein
MVCDLLQKIELFHTAGTQMVPPHGPDVVKAFYDILTVLDSKGFSAARFRRHHRRRHNICCRKRRRLSPPWNGAMAGDLDHHPVAGRIGIVPLGFRNLLFVLPLCRLYRS